MAVAFSIDGNLMTNGPSEIELTPVEAAEQRTTDGGYVATVRSKGAQIKVTWGIGAAVIAAIAELRTARGTTVAHTISWVDHSGVTQTYKINWLGLPAIRMAGDFYGRLTLTFNERPD